MHHCRIFTSFTYNIITKHKTSGDARKLKKIADEKDQEKDLHTLILEQQQKELDEKQQRDGDGGKKKKKKKRRRTGSKATSITEQNRNIVVLQI